MGRLIACTALVGLALIPVSPRASDVYSYVDEQGVVHFTNAPTDGRFRRIARAKAKSPDVHEITIGPRGGSTAAARPASVARHLSKRDYDQHIKAAAERYQLPEALLRAVMVAESNLNANARSPKGAMGLMQLMPGTAKDMFVADAWDPAQNIEGGARYLRILANQYDGDVEKTLAAYNAGPEAVRRAGGIPNYQETREYVRKVVALYELFTNRS
jgi:soluble lytic murein transglycosylase-like protein